MQLTSNGRSRTRRHPAHLAALREIAATVPDRCSIEHPSESTSSILDADFMISDWSGVAYEFAFATERPVLFIDGPRKINAQNWEVHKLSLMEDVCRREIGIVIGGPGEIATGLREVAALDPAQWSERIAAARANYLFNFNHAAEAAADTLLRLCRGDSHLGP